MFYLKNSKINIYIYIFFVIAAGQENRHCEHWAVFLICRQYKFKIYTRDPLNQPQYWWIYIDDCLKSTTSVYRKFVLEVILGNRSLEMYLHGWVIAIDPQFYCYWHLLLMNRYWKQISRVNKNISVLDFLGLPGSLEQQWILWACVCVSLTGCTSIRMVVPFRYGYDLPSY